MALPKLFPGEVKKKISYLLSQKEEYTAPPPISALNFRRSYERAVKSAFGSKPGMSRDKRLLNVYDTWYDKGISMLNAAHDYYNYAVVFYDSDEWRESRDDVGDLRRLLNAIMKDRATTVSWVPNWSSKSMYLGSGDSTSDTGTGNARGGNGDDDGTVETGSGGGNTSGTSVDPGNTDVNKPTTGKTMTTKIYTEDVLLEMVEQLPKIANDGDQKWFKIQIDKILQQIELRKKANMPIPFDATEIKALRFLLDSRWGMLRPLAVEVYKFLDKLSDGSPVHLAVTAAIVGVGVTAAAAGTGRLKL